MVAKLPHNVRRGPPRLHEERSVRGGRGRSAVDPLPYNTPANGPLVSDDHRRKTRLDSSEGVVRGVLGVPEDSNTF